jgi:ubiquinone/menaquinone biosynthesis C-methylase UbiE
MNEDENEKTAQIFDSYGDRYSEAVNEALAFSGLSVDFFTKVKADYLIDLTSRRFGGTSSCSVLDIGCGVGNFHPILAPKFGSLSGVDISSASIEIARKRNPAVAYEVYDGMKLPYEDSSFDAAFTVCVMHHVPPAQWPLFVSEMKRIVKPGGLAMVFEHNPRNPLTMRIVNRCPFDEDAVLLKPETTMQLFEDAGFSELRTRSILTIPAAGAALRFVDQFFGRLPLGAQYFLAATKPN